MKSYIQASPKDNLITCTKALAAGQNIELENQVITIRQDIPVYHKVAIRDVKKGEPVLKYGQVIGIASQDILMGDHVHVHNVESTRGRGDRGSVKELC